MPETTKITIEKDGEPTVVIVVDVRDPPLSLGQLLDRARAAREAAGALGIGVKTAENTSGSAQNAKIPPTREQVLEKLRRLAQGIADGVFQGENLQPSEARVLLEMLHPPMLVVPGTLSPEDMELLKPGGFFHVVPDLENDLEDVLDSYRLAQRACGVQVISVTEVYAWVGDIQAALTEPQWKAWGQHREPAVFRKCWGANALEDAAKWLRSQLESQP